MASSLGPIGATKKSYFAEYLSIMLSSCFLQSNGLFAGISNISLWIFRVIFILLIILSIKSLNSGEVPGSGFPIKIAAGPKSSINDTDLSYSKPVSNNNVIFFSNVFSPSKKVELLNVNSLQTANLHILQEKRIEFLELPIWEGV